MAFGNAVTGAAFGVLNELLGLIRSADGIAKSARYEVLFFPPSGGSQNPFASVINQMRGDGTAREVSLKCEQISMPGRNIDTAPDTNIYGPEREVVTGYSFGDINAVFQCSSDMREKKYWETWQRLCYNPQTFDIGYYHDYTGSVEIHTLDEQENRRYGVKLVEAYPKSIAAQSLGYATNNSYQTIDVTIAYRYWVNLTDEPSSPKSLGTRIVERVANTVERRINANIPSVLRRL